MSASKAELRKFPRFTAECEALVGEMGAKTLRAKGWTQNIGPGGMLVLCDEALSPGVEVRSVLVVSGRLILARGKVVHQTCAGDAEFEVGIKFAPLSRNVEKTISSLPDMRRPDH